jgi:hypothetical protein
MSSSERAAEMVAWLSASGESEKEEGNGGSSSAPWHLDATCDLTGGPAVGVWTPRRVHAVATACGRSATELSSFTIQRLTKLTDSQF